MRDHAHAEATRACRADAVGRAIAYAEPLALLAYPAKFRMGELGVAPRVIERGLAECANAGADSHFSSLAEGIGV
jgi:hypothetical protein